MKEQIPLPIGEKGSEDQESEGAKSLERPALPKLPKRITGYRCSGKRQSIDLMTGRILESPCKAMSDSPGQLCHPQAIYEGEEEKKDE